jgi:hypothetical protein
MIELRCKVCPWSTTQKTKRLALDAIDRHYKEHEFERSVLNALNQPLYLRVPRHVPKIDKKRSVP